MRRFSRARTVLGIPVSTDVLRVAVRTEIDGFAGHGAGQSEMSPDVIDVSLSLPSVDRSLVASRGCSAQVYACCDTSGGEQ